MITNQVMSTEHDHNIDLDRALMLMLNYSEKTFETLKAQCEMNISECDDSGMLAGKPSRVSLQEEVSLA